ncbi:MAG: hypothetical protein HKN23_17325, partial [Verrucomicrobiales bacterium]|nr:hypothetical protein [Verrucomicrobiales bacterium]
MRTFVGLFFVIFLSGTPQARADGPPFQACGIKIGEVSTNSAIIWTRLTKNAESNPASAPWFEIHFEKSGWVEATDMKMIREPALGVRFDEGAKDENDIAFAVPGMP